MTTATFSYEGVPVEICRRRMRRILIRVRADGSIRLSHPWHVPRERALDFLREKWQWALAERGKALARQAARGPVLPPADVQALADALRGRLEALLARWCALLGEAPPRRVTIRDMATRWGSCTPGRRTLRFSLRLAAAPDECVEYVVVHELTHFRVLNHGPEFQALMSGRLPDWRSRRKRLNSL